MAYICSKPAGSCSTCNHFRFDDERNRMACFAKEDERMENIKVVSVAQFERETGIHISHLTGKMDKVRAISTYAGDNPSCLALMKCKDTVCSHCYAYKQVESGIYPNQRTCLERNGKALSGALLNIVPNLSKQQIFRFESHGDVINVTHARNYIRIAKSNPTVQFGAWSKRPEVWKAALKEEGKPANLRLVYSSPMLNMPVNIKKAYPFFDSEFTVYEKEATPAADSWKCRCSKGSCNSCRFCYTKSGNIAEVLR